MYQDTEENKMSSNDPVAEYVQRLGNLKRPSSGTFIGGTDDYSRGERGSFYVITESFTSDELRELVDKFLGIPEATNPATTLRPITYVIPLTPEQVSDAQVLNDFGGDFSSVHLSAIIGRADINCFSGSSSHNDWITNMRNLTERVMATQFGRDNYGVRINGSGGKKYFDSAQVIRHFSPELARVEFPKYS